MSSFWDRKLAEIKGPGHTPPPPPPPSPYPPVPGTVVPSSADADVPSYVRQGLAVQHRGTRENTDLEHRIRTEGYIRKPPLWVQRQPRDFCPNCGGPDYAAVSSGGYSRPGAPGTILRCFDCGYSSGRGVSALWGVPSSGPVVGAAVQSRDGHVNLRNTGLITG